MNIIFDLDGTLIDASNRLYRLFQKLVPQSSLTKEEYWERKRNKIGHELILEREFPEISFNDFNLRWMRLIETTEYLNLDCCYFDTINTLQKLKNRNNLYLLTARQNKYNLLKELGRLHLIKFFKNIFVTENKKSKEELLEIILATKDVLFSKEDMFVSDMGKDIKVGNKFNFLTVAITHGFMAKDKLMWYDPKYCIDELSELLNLIN